MCIIIKKKTDENNIDKVKTKIDEKIIKRCLPC